MKCLKASLRKFSTIRINGCLFGIKELTSSNDFITLSDNVIGRVDKLRHLIRTSLGKHDPRQTLQALDQVSNEVCSVIDAAELCRNVHIDEAYRDMANKAFSKLSEYIHQLNTDIGIYEKLVEVMESEECSSQLLEEDILFATDLRYEFETGGIHLPGLKGDLLASIKNAIIETESHFTINAIKDHTSFVIGPILNSQYNWFRDWLNRVVPRQTTGSTLPHRHLLCTSERVVCNTVLKYADSRSVRHQVWVGHMMEPVSNRDTLCALIRNRHRQAELLGYSSHAHYVLNNKILTTPNEVQAFLEATADSSRPAAERESVLLRELLRASSVEDDEVRPWDISRLIEQHKLSSPKAMSGVRDVSRFLSLPVCMDGLRWTLDSLFGISLEAEVLRAGEGWVDTQHASGVSKYSLQKDGDVLGTVYLDLYSRPNKFNSAAHFTVRCGCSSALRTEASVEERQLPVVALVFGFQPPAHGSETLLTLHELETFYHEWGHALHSLLSRTTYQHLSGTRGGADFVEVPSHLFEHFARCPAVVGQWAKDSQGHRMPSGMLEEALMERKSFGATELQLQLLYAGADQFIFGPELGSRVTFDFDDVLSGVANVQQRLTCLALSTDGLPSAPPLLTSTHLVNYGGLYHSYLLARMFASQIWTYRFAADPLSRDAGLVLWHKMLGLGSSRSPKAILKDMAGGELLPSHYLQEVL